MPANTAAWIPARSANLKVGPAPYTAPGENEIVVRSRAVAVNPVDWIKQVAGDMIFPWIKYPFVLGSDVAGEVAEVGQGVTRFKTGDRVLGHAIGQDPNRNRAAEGAFQIYTVLLAHMAAPLPDGMSYESAAVLPLGLSTAACGLFQKDHLALRHPATPPSPNGETLLIWGGSTSVGCNAIQLAVAAGYEVITTASPRNFDYVRSLGASQVFDYNSDTVIQDLIAAFRGKTLAGALAIGATSAEACVDVVAASQGHKFVSTASFPLSFASLPQGRGMLLGLMTMLPKLLWFSATMLIKTRTRGIRTKFIFGSSLMANEVGPLIYAQFLPRALAAGQFVAAPPAQVVGEGLPSIQAAFAAQKTGVSARKIVVTLPA